MKSERGTPELLSLPYHFPCHLLLQIAPQLYFLIKSSFFQVNKHKDATISSRRRIKLCDASTMRLF